MPKTFKNTSFRRFKLFNKFATILSPLARLTIIKLFLRHQKELNFYKQLDF